MANVVSGTTVKLNNGQTVNAQQGGWYDGQQFFNGSLSNPGQINSQSNQPGAGQQVSAAVVAQTNPANVAYIQQQQQQQPQQPAQPAQAPQPQVQPQGGAPTGGSTGGVSLPQGQPTFDLVSATNQAYNTPEITAANQAITDANTKITARQQALADAQAEINDNPFYSEATRVGRSAKLTAQANADMTVLQNEAKQAQDQVATLKADAAVKVNAALGQYNINNDAYKQSLTNFSNLVSAGALDNASGTDLANLSVQTGIPVSMIQSIQAQSIKKDNPVEKPQIVQSTDNEGNLSIIAVDPITGEVLQQTTIAGAGKTAKGSGGGTNDIPSQSQLKTDAGTAAKSGKTYADLLNFFGTQGLSPSDIYKIYTAANYYGRPPDGIDSKTGLPG